MIKAKKLLIVWALAFASVVVVPVTSYVTADPSMECTDGRDSGVSGGVSEECEVIAYGNPSNAQKAGEWADAFDLWCYEDGYDAAECLMAQEVYERALIRYFEGATTEDPRLKYPAWYPGGSKGTVPNPKKPRYITHPGKVPEPVPDEPTREPSVICGCHFGDPTVHEYPA